MTVRSSLDNFAEAESEPDYRFTLANERTFLAWIRTGMALLAGGVAVREITSSLRYPWAVDALALMCIAVSITVAVGAYYHWRGTQSDMRRSRPLHAPWLIPALSGAVSLIAVACCVVVLL